MEHEGLGHSAKMFFRLSCSWLFVGQMVPRSRMCKEVNGSREFILMNRGKGSPGTQAAAGILNCKCSLLEREWEEGS